MLPHHYFEDRPWGSFERFTKNEPSTVKILRVSPGARLSLQRHAARREFWQVVEGAGIARIGDEDRVIVVGDSVEIPVDTLHRLTGGPQGIVVLEIALGHFDEDDIDRIEDDFGRT